MAENIPADLLCYDIMPKFDMAHLHDLLEQCIAVHDHYFIRYFLFPAVMRQNEEQLEHLDLVRLDSFVIYAIHHFTLHHIDTFLLKTMYPSLCKHPDPMKLWHAVVQRGDLSIFRMFMDECSVCMYTATNAIIDARSTFMLQRVIENGVCFPRLHHFMRCLLRLDRLSTNVLIDRALEFPAVLYGLHLDLKKYMKHIMFPNLYENDELFGLVYDVSTVLTSSSSKQGRWMYKQIRRLQKVLRYPYLLGSIIDYKMEYDDVMEDQYDYDY